MNGYKYLGLNHCFILENDHPFIVWNWELPKKKSNHSACKTVTGHLVYIIACHSQPENWPPEFLCYPKKSTRKKMKTKSNQIEHWFGPIFSRQCILTAKTKSLCWPPFETCKQKIDKIIGFNVPAKIRKPGGSRSQIYTIPFIQVSSVQRPSLIPWYWLVYMDPFIGLLNPQWLLCSIIPYNHQSTIIYEVYSLISPYVHINQQWFSSHQ